MIFNFNHTVSIAHSLELKTKPTTANCLAIVVPDFPATLKPSKTCLATDFPANSSGAGAVTPKNPPKAKPSAPPFF
jgi:hypothetical protein